MENGVPASHERVDVSPSAIRHAGELVNELKDLKHEMKNALVGAMQWKVPNQQEIQVDAAGNNGLAQFASFTAGPFPLDDYLKAGADVTTSPYPKLRAGAGKSGNAPVIASFADAEETLQKIMTSREYLHDNLDAILRHHNDAEVVTFMEELTKDASAAERFRIKKMVDDLIAGMNTELEREIMEEMLKVKNQSANRSIMIPERDTNTKAKATKPGAKGRFNVGSRIDSGLKKGNKPAVPPAKKTKAFMGARTSPKSVAFTARPKPVAKNKTLDSETYLTRVYGKALYHSSRNTQRDPKIRYNAASPTSKLAHSPSRISKMVVAEAKQATEPASGGRVDHYYFTPYTRGQEQPQPQTVASGVTHALGMQGDLVPMAIPLGAPRQKTGAPPPAPAPAPFRSSVPSTPNLPSSSPFASTPLDGHQTPRPQVSVHTEDNDSVARSELDDRLPGNTPINSPRKRDSPRRRDSPRKARDQALSPIRPPSREASHSSETATTAVHKMGPPPPPMLADEPQEPEVVVEESKDADGYDDDFEESDDTITESQEEEVIDIPGYSKPPSGPHHGPQFPPQAPCLNPTQSSDVLGSDMKRNDILANHAMEWVEQELMARMLSEMAEKQTLQKALSVPPPVDIKPRAPRPATSPHDSEYSSDESFISTSRQPLIAGSIGREGLQMFIDAGMPVDDHLVNALIQDVILEKISSMVGQHGRQAEDQQRQPPPPPVTAPSPKPRSRPSSPMKSSSIDNQLPPARKSPLPTPELTPRTSPLVSPRYERDSPPATPDLTPASSLSESLPIAVKPARRPSTERQEERQADRQIERQAHFERQVYVERHDTTEESDTIEEYVPPSFSTGRRDVISPTFIPRHDVRTPSITPPASPGGSEAYTPEVSIEEKAPTQKEPEPIKIETKETGIMVNFTKIVRAYEIDNEEVIDRRSTETQTVETEPEAKPNEDSPPPSPRPWSDPEDSTAEEALTGKDVDQNELQEDRPKVPATIATQTSRRSPSPTPSNTQDESTVSSVVSHDDAISEGEWLLTLRSEGEVRPVPLAHAGGPPITPIRGRRIDDTLHSTEELDLEQEGQEMSIDFEPSEGEIMHDTRVPPEQDPMLAYLYEMQNNPMKMVEHQLRMNQMAAAAGAGANLYGPAVNKSLGEVSFGVPYGQQFQVPGQQFHSSPIHHAQQRPVEVRPAPKSILVQPGRGGAPAKKGFTAHDSGHSLGELPSPGLVDGNSTSAESISDTQEGPYPPLNSVEPDHINKPENQEQNSMNNLALKPPKAGEVPISHDQKTGNIVATNDTNQLEQTRESSEKEEISPAAETLNESLGMTGGSVSSSREPMRLAEARKSGLIGGPIMSTENVSRGGRRGARPGSARGRLVQGRPVTPDEGLGRGTHLRISQENELRDTLESVDGFKSTGGSDFRTMTPDQINVDALLQSGQYLNQTMSTEGGSTTEFGRTGEMGTVRSTEFTRSSLQQEEYTGEFETRENQYSKHLRVSYSDVNESRSYEAGSVEEGTRSRKYGEQVDNFGTRSGEFSTMSRDEDHHRNGVHMSGTFGRSGRLNYTTSEFGQTGSEYNYSSRYSENGEAQDHLQASGRYPDSLEGTGELTYTGALRKTYEDSEDVSGVEHSPASRSGPIQVSVTIPSMAQSDSASDDGGSGSVEDVSEISLGK